MYFYIDESYEVTSLIQKYIEEIEELRTKLCESESGCEVLRRALNSLKTPQSAIYASPIPIKDFPVVNGLSHQSMSSSCLESLLVESTTTTTTDEREDTLLFEAKADIQKLKIRLQ